MKKKYVGSIFLMLCSVAVYAMDKKIIKRRVRKSGPVEHNMHALEQGLPTQSDPIQQATEYIADHKNLTDTFLKAHLYLLVQELQKKDQDRYVRLRDEMKRGHASDRNEINKIYSVLEKISESLQYANDLHQEEIIGGGQDEIVQTRRWHLDNCREWTIGLLGAFGTNLITFLVTYFASTSSIQEC